MFVQKSNDDAYALIELNSEFKHKYTGPQPKS